MNINPIYEREHRVSTRSLRLAMTILVFNFVVAGVTLIEMNTVVDFARKTSNIDYVSFLRIFRVVIFLQAVLLIFVTPSFIAGTVSDERQRGTMEILLTTKMSVYTIVFGKFLSLFVSIMLVVLSQLPLLAVLFLYGGISVPDILLLAINFTVFIILLISMGIFCSALVKRTSIATALLYIAVLALFAGTLLIYNFAENSFMLNENSFLGICFIKFSKALLLFNPLVSMDFILSRIMGETTSNILIGEFWYESWFYISMILEILLSAVFLLLSVCKIKPHCRVWRKHGNNKL